MDTRQIDEVIRNLQRRLDDLERLALDLIDVKSLCAHSDTLATKKIAKIVGPTYAIFLCSGYQRSRTGCDVLIRSKLEHVDGAVRPIEMSPPAQAVYQLEDAGLAVRWVSEVAKFNADDEWSDIIRHIETTRFGA